MSNLYVLTLHTKIAGKRKTHEDRYCIVAGSKEEARAKFDAAYPGHAEQSALVEVTKYEDGICRAA